MALALNLFIQDLSEDEFFTELAKAFSLLPTERRAGYVESLIAMFDRGNWTQEAGTWSYEPP